MRGYLSLLSMVLGLMFPVSVYCQTMQGQVIDIRDMKSIDDVNVMNIHSSTSAVSNEEGHFNIDISPGDLIEFRKQGYKTIRLRVPAGKQPFYRIALEKGPCPAPTNKLDYIAAYKADSERYYAMYKHALEFPEMSGLDILRHPFSAMSKKNQQVWGFQKEFNWFQQQKFIDYAFNEKIVAAITGLKGDSATVYMQMFRPSYDQLRGMDEYTYFVYLKKTVEAYRERGIRARMSPSRNSN